MPSRLSSNYVLHCWERYLCVVNWDAVLRDIILSWNSTRAFYSECLLCLPGLNCMLRPHLTIDDSPKLQSKVIVLIMDPFFFDSGLISVEKQFRTCGYRILK